jgi:hypothetical protein
MGLLWGVWVWRLDFERPEMNLDLSLRVANTIGLLREAQEPHGRRRLGGIDTVYDGCMRWAGRGAGAQGGVLHGDEKTLRPNCY